MDSRAGLHSRREPHHTCSVVEQVENTARLTLQQPPKHPSPLSRPDVDARNATSRRAEGEFRGWLGVEPKVGRIPSTRAFNTRICMALRLGVAVLVALRGVELIMTNAARPSFQACLAVLNYSHIMAPVSQSPAPAK